MDKPKLTEQNLVDAANSIGCSLAMVKAVTKIEAPRGGFLRDGTPVILFERHIFSRLTGHKYDTTNPDVSNQVAGGYQGVSYEYSRLAKASELDREAALMSCSWGMFQIMGMNYAACGYTSVDTFVNGMYESEGKQLEAFVEFVKSIGLVQAMAKHDFVAFARKYNGPAYAKNSYDQKLRQAYLNAGGVI